MTNILPRYLNNDHAQWEAKLARILIDTGEPTPPTNTTRKLTGYRSGEGDRQRMRAIPVIAEGVGGTIPGTHPLAALIAKDPRRPTT